MGKYTDDEICNAAKITIKIAADYLSISPNILTLGMRNNLPYNVIPSIWYFEPANSMGFVPTDYVDITDYFDTKMKMLSCMESQKQWMADNYAQLGGDTERFYDTIRITSEFRGMQAGCKYAEGFVRALDGYRTRLTERVLP